MHNTWWIALVGLLICIVSCSQPETEVLEFSDIAPVSGEQPNGEEETTAIVVDSLQERLLFFRKHGIVLNGLALDQRSVFPDRFGPLKSIQYQLYMENDTLFYSEWVFADSSKVMNAFFNWLDCFGPKCRSFYIGEEARFQFLPMTMRVNDTVLIYIEGKNKIDFRAWDAFFEYSDYSVDWNFIIEQQKGGKSKWFTAPDATKIPYTK